MKNLLIRCTFLTPIWVSAQISVGTSLSYLNMPVGEIENRALSNPTIKQDISYATGLELSYKKRRNRVVLETQFGVLNKKLTNMTFYVPLDEQRWEREVLLDKANLRNYYLAFNLSYFREVAKLKKGHKLYLSLGYTSYGFNTENLTSSESRIRCPITNGKGNNQNTGETHEFYGLERIQDAIIVGARLEKKIKGTKFTYYIAPQFQYHLGYNFPAPFGDNFRASNLKIFRRSSYCNAVMIETYNKPSFQLKAGITLSLDKRIK